MCFLHSVEYGLLVLSIARPAQDLVGGVLSVLWTSRRCEESFFWHPDDRHYNRVIKTPRRWTAILPSKDKQQ